MAAAAQARHRSMSLKRSYLPQCARTVAPEAREPTFTCYTTELSRKIAVDMHVPSDSQADLQGLRKPERRGMSTLGIFSHSCHTSIWHQGQPTTMTIVGWDKVLDPVAGSESHTFKVGHWIHSGSHHCQDKFCIEWLRRRDIPLAHLQLVI